MSSGSRQSVNDYLKHHLHHWQIGSGFWAINLDTLLISWLLMAAVVYFFNYQQKEFGRLQQRPPSRLQTFLELIIEFSRDLTRPFYSYENIFAGAATFSILVFLGLSNLMAFLPPDLFPYCLKWVGIPNFKVQISSDLNFCLGLAFISVGLSIFRPFQIFGLKGLISLFAGHPFPHWAFFLVNVPINFMAMNSKLLSLTIRLLANMLVGDMGFLLLAAFVSWQLQWLPWQLWMLVHCMVIPLQTYLFVLFSAVYLSLGMSFAGSSH